MIRWTALVVLGSLALYGCGDDESEAPPAGATTSSSTGGSGGTGGQGGSGAGEVTLTTYVGTTQANVLFVAAQDGDGAWQPLTGSDGVYTFTSSGRFGIVYVCDAQMSTPTIVFVVQATTADFTSLVRVCEGAVPTNTSTVSGFAYGFLGSEDTVSLIAGPYAGANADPAVQTYSMEVPQGTWDVVAASNGLSGTDAVAIHRDLVVGATDIDLDINVASEGTETNSLPMTINNVASGETVAMNSFLRMDDGGSMLFQGPDSQHFVAVPSSVLQGGETHLVNCFVSNASGGLRSAAMYAKNPMDPNFTLLDPMTATLSVSASDPPQFDASLGAMADALSYHLRIGQNTTNRRLFVDLSPAWLGSDAMLTYTTPNLTSLPGWDPNWDLAAGELTAWFASARASTGPAEFQDDPTPGVDPDKEGIVTRGTLQGGQVTP